MTLGSEAETQLMSIVVSSPAGGGRGVYSSWTRRDSVPSNPVADSVTTVWSWSLFCLPSDTESCEASNTLEAHNALCGTDPSISIPLSQS